MTINQLNKEKVQVLLCSRIQILSVDMFCQEQLIGQSMIACTKHSVAAGVCHKPNTTTLQPEEAITLQVATLKLQVISNQLIIQGLQMFFEVVLSI